MNDNAIPVACSLTQAKFQGRREKLALVALYIKETQARENGYAYRFASDAVLPELMEIVKAERRCCPFLRFLLTLEAGNGAIWLEVTGPQGTQEFLGSLFS